MSTLCILILGEYPFSCGCDSESHSVGEAQTDRDINTERGNMAIYYFTYLAQKNKETLKNGGVE